MLGLHISEHERGFKGGESMRVRPVKPITQAYFHQPTRKEIGVRAKVEEKPDATDRFEAAKPVCDRITRAAIVGAVVLMATQLLIWALR
jgi:hypothetical protein